MKGFIQFAAAVVVCFGVDAVLLHVLVAWTPIGPLSARAMTLAAATAIACLVNETSFTGKAAPASDEDRRRFRPVLLIAASGNYALYYSLLAALPGLQPLLALAAASFATIAFSFFGYARFVFRR